MIEVEKILKDAENLIGKNGTWRGYQEEVARFALPRKRWVVATKTSGEPLDLVELYDETAETSLRRMAGGIDYNLTNSAMKWFGLQTIDQKFMNEKSVDSWFYRFVEYLRYVLSTSNFDSVKQEYYIDKGCFGTGTIFIQENPDGGISFKNVPIEQINPVEDINEELSHMYRVFKLSAAAAYEQWGAKAGQEIGEKMKDKPYDEFEFIHYVGRRVKRDISSRDRFNMPYEEGIINRKERRLVFESGREEMPFVIGRFYKHASDVFGYSPAMVAKAKTLLINKQEQTALLRAMKEATPPMEAPMKGYSSPYDFNPHGMNFYDKLNANAGDLRPIPFNSNFSITVEVMEKTREAIKACFFLQELQAITSAPRQKTAYETQQLIAESMATLGPLASRDLSETWRPLIVRLAKIIIRQNEPYWAVGQAGSLPPPPQVLQGKAWGPVFSSPLARALQASEVNDLVGFLQIANEIVAGQINSANSPAADLLNFDKTIQKARELKGVDPELLNDERMVEAIRQARQKAIAAQQQQMQMAEMAKAANQGASAYKNVKQADQVQA
jgi:hypothetical protein